LRSSLFRFFFPCLWGGICCCAHFRQKRILKKEAAARAATRTDPAVPKVVDEEAQRLWPGSFLGAGPSTSSVREGYDVNAPPPAYTDPDDGYVGPLYTYPPLTVPLPLVHKAYPKDF